MLFERIDWGCGIGYVNIKEKGLIFVIYIGEK